MLSIFKDFILRGPLSLLPKVSNHFTASYPCGLPSIGHGQRPGRGVQSVEDAADLGPLVSKGGRERFQIDEICCSKFELDLQNDVDKNTRTLKRCFPVKHWKFYKVSRILKRSPVTGDLLSFDFCFLLKMRNAPESKHQDFQIGHTSISLANLQEKPVALFAIYDGHFGTKHLAIKETVDRMISQK